MRQKVWKAARSLATSRLPSGRTYQAERVGFVDEEDEGLGGVGAEGAEVADEGGLGVGEEVVEGSAIGAAEVGVTPGEGAVESGEEGAEGERGIGLLAGGLDVDPEGAAAAALVEVIFEPHQRGGLAGLAARVEGEVLALLDQLHDPAEAPLRGQHVVLAGDAGAGGVERQLHVEEPRRRL